MSRGTAGRRIVSISLPSFPMERWLRRTARTGCAPPADLPLALWVEGGHGPVVHATNRAAAAAGVRLGARLADTRAVCPALRAEPADPQGDAAALDRLALWARRFCPWTAADRSGPDATLGIGAALVLDTTGADHLWGGEPAMLAAIEGELAVRGLDATLAVAPTWGAAWGLARFGGVRAVADRSEALHPLPVAALRLTPDTVLLLRRLGLRTVADLAAIPRLSLARRFSRMPATDNPQVRLDQATGRLPEPLDPPEPPAVFRARARLPEPVLDPTQNLPGLCEALCRDLAAAHHGARQLRLSVWRVDGALRWIDAGAATATRDPAHIAFLFRERLERIDPGFGFDLIELSAPRVEPLAPAQHDLAGEPQGALALPRLIDRLEARFGPGRVTRPEPRESHVPERAMDEGAALAPALPARNTPARRKAGGAARPSAGPASRPAVEPPAAFASGNRARLSPPPPAGPVRLTLAPVAEIVPPVLHLPDNHKPGPAFGAPASPPSAKVAPARSPTEAASPASVSASPALPVLPAAPRPGPSLVRSALSRPPPSLPLRPLRLFDPPAEVRVLYAVPEGPPAQFQWRGQPCRVARWQGPERIAPEWWADRPGTRLRDYYRVEDDTGRRLWLYREGLAGDGRGGVPRWFVHGIFA